MIIDSSTPMIQDIGHQDYHQIWQKMRDFTLQRDAYVQNEIWLVEHSPVFTLGRAGKISNLLTPINAQSRESIPMVKTDRGGDITYHGPGQFIAYLLFDIRRDGIGIKGFVRLLEQSVMNYLTLLGIESQRQERRPGIYTEHGKIAALGLNCKQYGTYHGVSINVNMDLSPFKQINPCGIPQAVTQIKQYQPNITLAHTKKYWVQCFQDLWQHR